MSLLQKKKKNFDQYKEEDQIKPGGAGDERRGLS